MQVCFDTRAQITEVCQYVSHMFITSMATDMLCRTQNSVSINSEITQIIFDDFRQPIIHYMPFPHYCDYNLFRAINNEGGGIETVIRDTEYIQRDLQTQ